VEFGYFLVVKLVHETHLSTVNVFHALFKTLIPVQHLKQCILTIREIEQLAHSRNNRAFLNLVF
jgi:hypothetical protein